MDVIRDKRELRAHIRAARATLGPESRAVAARSLAEVLDAEPSLASVSMVLAYRASAEELSIDPAAERLRSRGVVLAYPRVGPERTLSLHLVHDDEFVPGAFGILEPPAGAPRVEPGNIDAVLMPGLAFDREGFRLGYGGGYYDTLLPTLRPDCIRIGVCFELQVVDAVPREPHDLPVDLIATASGVSGTALRARPSG